MDTTMAAMSALTLIRSKDEEIAKLQDKIKTMAQAAKQERVDEQGRVQRAFALVKVVRDQTKIRDAQFEKLKVFLSELQARIDELECQNGDKVIQGVLARKCREKQIRIIQKKDSEIETLKRELESKKEVIKALKAEHTEKQMIKEMQDTSVLKKTGDDVNWKDGSLELESQIHDINEGEEDPVQHVEVCSLSDSPTLPEGPMDSGSFEYSQTGSSIVGSIPSPFGESNDNMIIGDRTALPDFKAYVRSSKELEILRERMDRRTAEKDTSIDLCFKKLLAHGQRRG